MQTDFLQLPVYGADDENNPTDTIEGFVDFNRAQLVSLFYNITTGILIINTTTVLSEGQSQLTTFPKQSVTNGKLEKSKTAFEHHITYKSHSRPAEMFVNKKQDIEAVYAFVYGKDYAFPGFAEHEKYLAKVEAAKIAAKQREETEALGLVNAQGEPLSAENTGKIITMD